jgi:hypothetical protein
MTTNSKVKRYIFTKTSRTFYSVIAESPEAAAEILKSAINEAEAYKSHVEISEDTELWYYGEKE